MEYCKRCNGEKKKWEAVLCDKCTHKSTQCYACRKHRINTYVTYNGVIFKRYICDPCLEKSKIDYLPLFYCTKLISIYYVAYKTSTDSFCIRLSNVVDQYIKQRGLCYLSGKVMTYYNISKQTLFKYNENIAIRLIDKEKGYVNNNFVLVCAEFIDQKNLPHELKYIKNGDPFNFCKNNKLNPITLKMESFAVKTMKVVQKLSVDYPMEFDYCTDENNDY
jgi:hypothetical protein